MMIKSIYSFSLLINVLNVSDASASPHSFYDQAPCDYSRILNPPELTETGECRAQIMADIRSNSRSFQLGNGPDRRAIAGSTLALLDLLSNFYPHEDPIEPICTPAELAQIRSLEFASRGIGFIDVDVQALSLSSLSGDQATVLRETIECYHYRNPETVYVQGFFDLLVPFVQMMDNAPNLELIYKSYHSLNSFIRSHFFDFGLIVQRLWKYRIAQYIGATGRSGRWFDKLLNRIIIRGPPPVFISLRLRMAQLMFVFGTRGALATYIVVGRNLWDILGDSPDTWPPLVNGVRPNSTEDVGNRVFTLLESRIGEITDNVLRFLEQPNIEFFNDLGSIEPRSGIESIIVGIRYNQFESNYSKRYFENLWLNTFLRRQNLKSSFVPAFPTPRQVYDALNVLRNYANDFSNVPRMALTEIDQVLADVCRVRGSVGGLPRNVALVGKLQTVVKPDDVDQAIFDALIVSIDTQVKDQVFTRLPSTCPGDIAPDPLAWVLTKLQLVISIATNIRYVQTNTHYAGISLDFVNNGIQSFNDAVGVLSSIFSGIGFENEEFSFIGIFSSPGILMDYIVPEVFPNSQDSHQGITQITPSLLPNFIIGSRIGDRIPHEQYLFGHILSCGITSNIATAIVVLRKALAHAQSTHRSDGGLSLELETGQRFLELIQKLEFDPAPGPPANPALLAETAERSFNSNEIRQELFQTYFARIFDLYNLFLFRGTLDMTEKFHRPETVVRNGNITVASLRVTEGNFLKIFTCGPVSYFRIRDGPDCSETFSFNPNVDMINLVRNDNFILSRFNHGKLCSVVSDGARGTTAVELALNDETSGWFGRTRTRRLLFIGGKDMSKNLFLDEPNSALDCIGTGIESPITQISCTFSFGLDQFIINRKKREICQSEWMTDAARRSAKIRSVCPSVGANLIRLQQAAFEAKIDEFKSMKFVIQDQIYTGSSLPFKVGIIGASGSHVRLCDLEANHCEFWPIDKRIADIPTLDKVVLESLIGINYVPNFSSFDNLERVDDYSLSIEKSGISFVNDRVILSCAFVNAEMRLFNIYRSWETRLPRSVSIDNPQQVIHDHCLNARILQRRFQETIDLVNNRPMRYRSSTGFEMNNEISNFFPGQFDHDIFVEYKRSGVSGFRVSIPNSCSIEFEVFSGSVRPTSTWQHASPFFHQVCRGGTPPSVDAATPQAIGLLEIPASFCDFRSVVIRCKMWTSSGDVIVVTQSAPVKSRNNFTNSIECRSNNQTRFDQTKTNHCLSLGSDLMRAIRSVPIAPP